MAKTICCCCCCCCCCAPSREIRVIKDRAVALFNFLTICFFHENHDAQIQAFDMCLIWQCLEPRSFTLTTMTPCHKSQDLINTKFQTNQRTQNEHGVNLHRKFIYKIGPWSPVISIINV